ncbi:MAG: hypothetical protein AB9856_12850 [Cellulosilyticaceae bacterium]
MSVINELKEQIKIKKMVLNVLQKERNETSYNRSNEEVDRKKQKLLDEIRSLEETIQSQKNNDLIK